MILKLPVGNMRSPTFALVDTTAMAIQPSPNVWRVPSFSDDGVFVRVRGINRHLYSDRLESTAADLKMPVDEIRAIFAAAVDAAREKWRSDAIDAMRRDYHNASVTLPAGESIDTHATVEDIERAINEVRGLPIVTVTHEYMDLPEFTERGLPERDAYNDDDIAF